MEGRLKYESCCKDGTDLETIFMSLVSLRVGIHEFKCGNIVVLVLPEEDNTDHPFVKRSRV